MTLSTQYIQSSRCFIRNWSGAITGKDIVDIHADILQHIDTGKDIAAVISDYTYVTEFSVSADNADDIAKASITLSKSLSRLSVAVVAPNPLIYGMSRMWDTLSSSTRWNALIFRTREEAESWLSKELGVISIYG